MGKVVPLHKANARSKSVAYGRGDVVQIFEGCGAAYEPLRAGFERILSFEPESKFLLLDCGDSVEYVRC